MTGYPYTYGDDRCIELDTILLKKVTLLCLLAMLVTVDGVGALEPIATSAVKSHTTKDVSKIATGALCVACGATCSNLSKTPAGKAVIFCVAFCTWCAAKSSPI